MAAAPAAGAASGSAPASTSSSSRWSSGAEAGSSSSHPVNTAWSKAAQARDSVAAARAAFAERQAASAFTDDRPPPTPEEIEAEEQAALSAAAGSKRKKKSTAQAFLKPTVTPPTAPPFFASHAYDHAAAGIAAGIIATICMNPLDLIKTKFQVDTRVPKPLKQALQPRNLVMAPVSISLDMYRALSHIVQQDGWKGLYRGISPNVAGNASSWGLYFLWYTWIKEYMAARNGKLPDGRTKPLSAGQHLLAATESGAITALMTNPIWVVKTRMFTTTRDGMPANTALAPATRTGAAITAGASAAAVSGQAGSPATAPPTSAASTKPGSGPAYNTLWSSLKHIYSTEGIRGLWKGAGLALVGVSNGAIQFAAYEQLKRWRTKVALSKLQAKAPDGSAAGPVVMAEETSIQLPNFEYVVISGSAKMIAITITYPYQVVRSRIQNHSTAHIYPNIPTCIRLTYAQEGLRAFYKGMTANAFRILPGTCVTFVVYENVSWTLRRAAERREARLQAIRDEVARAKGGVPLGVGTLAAFAAASAATTALGGDTRTAQ